MNEQVDTGTVRASELADWLLSHGRSSITTNDVAELLGIPAPQVRVRLRAPMERNEIVSPARGLWIPVPATYRTWGAPPAIHIIDDLMRHLDRSYYVGWLSSAEIHGAAHQRPQVFQVAVDRILPKRVVGRSRLDFAERKAAQDLPRTKHQVPTGYTWIATPELTVLDLCTDPVRGAGLSNVATVLAELADEGRVDLAALADLSRMFPVSAGRRAGWLLDLVASDLELDALLAALRYRSGKPTLLRPEMPDRGPVDRRWDVRVNGEVEPDL